MTIEFRNNDARFFVLVIRGPSFRNIVTLNTCGHFCYYAWGAARANEPTACCLCARHTRLDRCQLCRAGE